jgi:hypothetical protein
MTGVPVGAMTGVTSLVCAKIVAGKKLLKNNKKPMEYIKYFFI